MANSLDLSSVSQSSVKACLEYAAKKNVKVYVNGVEANIATSQVAPNNAVVDRAAEKHLSLYWKKEYPLFMPAAPRGNNNKATGNAVVPSSFSPNDVAQQLKRWLEVYGCNTSAVSPMHYTDSSNVRVNAHQVSWDVQLPNGKRESFTLEIKKLNTPPTK